jgi:hypothetical protein
MPAVPLWWARPGSALLWFVLPLYIALYLTPYVTTNDFVGVAHRLYFTFDLFALGLAFLLLCCIGCYAGEAGLLTRQSETEPWYVPQWLLWLFAGLTIVGYGVWFSSLIDNPILLLDILGGVKGASAAAREELETISGVTTMTQFGVTYVVLYFAKHYVLRQEARLRRIEQALLVSIFALATMRAFVRSERLALLELAIPALVIWLSFTPVKERKIRLLRQLGPLAGIVILVPFFGLFEFFRSWSSYYADREDNFLVFALSRLSAYYFTALNNGAGFLVEFPWPSFSGEFVLRWAYKFPILGPELLSAATPAFRYASFLDAHASPEFNNPSGIFIYFADLGTVPTIALTAAFGLAVGALYRRYELRTPAGVLLLPLVVISIYEILRIPYLIESRTIPAAAGLVFSLAVVHYVRLASRWSQRPDDGGSGST